MLPDYVAKAVPNPPSNRAPWYVNTAPSYAGIFLWIAFYQTLAVGTIDRAGIGVCLAALAVAGVLSYALYYLAPAMLGMKTGFYVRHQGRLPDAGLAHGCAPDRVVCSRHLLRH
jgi:cytosine permease